MLQRITLIGLCIAVSIGHAGFAQNRYEHAAPPVSNAGKAQSHVAAAKKIAGNDALLLHHFNFFCVPASTSTKNLNATKLEAIKLFDNVHAISDAETTADRREAVCPL